jgi:N-hydroxyarylamine O-acetyltransferase
MTAHDADPALDAGSSLDAYLARLGLDRAAVEPADSDALRQLQRAHVTTVPFETLSITGDPLGECEPGGVDLDLGHLHEKLVDRERGGYCFELNGLFGWLLAELGFDADRVAGRVSDSPPANHHAFVVHADRSYVVDVGLGGTRVRRPVPVDGTVVEDEAGYAWRVVDSDRPDVDHRVEARGPGDDAFERRYVFDATPRDLSYFAATCDYLATAPESPFTGDTVVSLATDRGRKKLTPDSLIRFEGGERTEQPVAPEEWHDVLDAEFGLRCR